MAVNTGPRWTLITPTFSIGWVVALLVLIGVLVLWITGRLPNEVALITGGLAVARLL